MEKKRKEIKLVLKIYQNFKKLVELWDLSLNDAFIKFMDIFCGRSIKSTIKSTIKNLLEENISNGYKLKRSE